MAFVILSVYLLDRRDVTLTKKTEREVITSEVSENL